MLFAVDNSDVNFPEINDKSVYGLMNSVIKVVPLEA